MLDNELIPTVSDKLRELSARLLSSIPIIPGYKWLELCQFVRKTQDIRKASALLMRISNSIGPTEGETINKNAEENRERAEKIGRLLKIS